MRHRSNIDSLSGEVRRWLERALTGSNFADYAELKGLLKGKGYSITCSSLQQFDYKVEQQLARVWAATEAVCLLAREAGDDLDNRSAGLVTPVQTEMTDILMCPQESWKDDDPFARIKLLAAASKNIATLTRASVNLKHYQAEARERVERAVAAIEKITHKSGLSVKAVQALRREIPGVVSWWSCRHTFLAPRVTRSFPLCCPTSSAGWQMSLRLR